MSDSTGHERAAVIGALFFRSQGRKTMAIPVDTGSADGAAS
jgi:hypothetical protein